MKPAIYDAIGSIARNVQEYGNRRGTQWSGINRIVTGPIMRHSVLSRCAHVPHIQVECIGLHGPLGDFMWVPTVRTVGSIDTVEL